MNAPIAPGVLLVATPSMVDPNFEGTVVLLCIHEPEGSVGLVLNRPLALAAREVLPEADLPTDPATPLHWGGPVAPQQVHLLHSSDLSAEAGRAVSGPIHFGGGLDAARKIAAGGGRLRFFAGYAGWGEGQLEEEFDGGSWYVLPPDEEEAWATDAQWQWERLVARAAPELGWLRGTERPEAN